MFICSEPPHHPVCASYCLRKTAIDNKYYSKETLKAVAHNNYVDDFLISVPTVEEAAKLVKELPDLLEKGGFHLTKWNSNRRQLLAEIPEKDRAVGTVSMDFDAQPCGESGMWKTMCSNSIPSEISNQSHAGEFCQWSVLYIIR